MLIELATIHAPGAVIRLIDATDPATTTRLRFPGSPTIRVDGVDPALMRYLTDGAQLSVFDA